MNRGFKRFNDAHFYLDSLNLLKYTLKIVKELSKDHKFCFGNDLIKDIKCLLIDFRKAFEESNSKNKHAIIKDNIVVKLRDIETTVVIMSESKIISISATSTMAAHIGVLEKQVKGWLKNVEKNLDIDL